MCGGEREAEERAVIKRRRYTYIYLSDILILNRIVWFEYLPFDCISLGNDVPLDSGHNIRKDELLLKEA